MTLERKRCDNQYPNVLMHLAINEKSDGYIEALHPEGFFDGTNIFIERRELIRPEINYRKSVINVLSPIIICTVICWWSVFYAIVGLLIYSLIRLREIIIWFIRIYQRYASEDIRLSCVFEPSCSEYMILSIKKYGAVRGCFKGIKRLLRCRYPNGGEDYP